MKNLRPQMYNLPRPAVGWFALEMEAKLQENDGKGGWDDCEIKWLLKRARQELDEVERALNARRSASVVIGETADAANFCMMIADRVAEQDEQHCWPPESESHA